LSLTNTPSSEIKGEIELKKLDDAHARHGARIWHRCCDFRAGCPKKEETKKGKKGGKKKDGEKKEEKEGL
jgi:hypothetical protein